MCVHTRVYFFREEMEKIMQNQEQAVFTLAAFPQTPVIITLSKGNSSNDNNCTAKQI